MALGTSLGALRMRVLGASRRASLPSLSPDADPHVVEVINLHYATLIAGNTWPHLRLTPRAARIPLKAGEVFYDLPDFLDPNRVEGMQLSVQGRIYPVVRGIGECEYDLFETAERELYVQRWDYRFTTAPQIEVWPTPATNDTFLEVKGFRATPRLVDDTDVCLLDDDLIVAYSVAELLASDKQDDAPLKQAQARELLRALTVNPQTTATGHRFGSGSHQGRMSLPRISVQSRGG